MVNIKLTPSENSPIVSRHSGTSNIQVQFDA